MRHAPLVLPIWTTTQRASHLAFSTTQDEGEMQVVLFSLECVWELSTVRLLLPSDLRALERRTAMAQSMKEAFRRCASRAEEWGFLCVKRGLALSTCLCCGVLSFDARATKLRSCQAICLVRRLPILFLRRQTSLCRLERTKVALVELDRA